MVKNNQYYSSFGAALLLLFGLIFVSVGIYAFVSVENYFMGSVSIFWGSIPLVTGIIQIRKKMEINALRKGLEQYGVAITATVTQKKMHHIQINKKPYYIISAVNEGIVYKTEPIHRDIAEKVEIGMELDLKVDKIDKKRYCFVTDLGEL